MIPAIPPVSWADLSDYVVLAGSHGYGTNTPTSDRDLRGFYLPSADDLLGFREVADNHVTQAGGKDDAFWEIRKFFRMCVSANPNVIETLFVPPENVLRATETGMAVRAARSLFLSRRLARTYLGYATGNYKRVQKAGEFDAKDAMHLIRLARTGLEVLRTGELRVNRPDDRAYLLSIRAGEVPFPRIAEEFEAAKAAWPEAEAKSPLPEYPNEGMLNSLLVGILGEHIRTRYGWLR